MCAIIAIQHDLLECFRFIFLFGVGGGGGGGGTSVLATATPTTGSFVTTTLVLARTSIPNMVVQCIHPRVYGCQAKLSATGVFLSKHN